MLCSDTSCLGISEADITQEARQLNEPDSGKDEENFPDSHDFNVLDDYIYESFLDYIASHRKNTHWGDQTNGIFSELVLLRAQQLPGEIQVLYFMVVPVFCTSFFTTILALTICRMNSVCHDSWQNLFKNACKSSKVSLSLITFMRELLDSIFVSNCSLLPGSL